MAQSILLPRVLLTNDDGFGSTGLDILSKTAGVIAQEVWIVAPEREFSGASQSLSLCRPVKATPKGDRFWAVDGSPCDCVALALSHFMKNSPPSLVLSGVNSGPNAGDDTNTSGTVGAALMALTYGIPAIAVSQCRNPGEPTPWDTTREVLPKLLRSLLAKGWRKETCLSVNIPNKPPSEIIGYSWARQGQKNVTGIGVEKRTSPRNEDYFWLTIQRNHAVAPSRSDLAALQKGDVAVTALSLTRSVDVARPRVHFDNPEQSETEDTDIDD